MNVLSLFGGIEVGYVACKELELDIENYYSSEICPNAIKVVKDNHSKVKHIGSVTEINMSKLPKIDLLVGGSPCQSFSFSGKRNGMTTKSNIEVLSLEHYLELKLNNFQFEGQSYLFWEFVRVLREGNIKHFMLENVMMNEKWKKIISNALGVEPFILNADKFSIQNRKRLFWTNWAVDTNVEDKGIMLRDNFDKIYDESLVLKGKGLNKLDRPRNRAISVYSDKCPTIMKSQDKLPTDAIVFEQEGVYRYPTRRECELMQNLPENYTKAVNYRLATGLIGNSWNKDTIVHILKSGNFPQKK